MEIYFYKYGEILIFFFFKLISSGKFERIKLNKKLIIKRCKLILYKLGCPINFTHDNIGTSTPTLFLQYFAQFNFADIAAGRPRQIEQVDTGFVGGH